MSCIELSAVDRLVSVIVPAFNAERTLAETLRSVAHQSHKCLEILIVDDGSTDATAAIATAFCMNDPRARLISKPNGGVASARNRGIAEARAEFVAPIDADDVWHPDFITRLLEKAIEAPVAPGFVHALSRHLDGNSRVVRSCSTTTAGGFVLGRMIYQNIVGNGSAMLILRSAALAAGGYDERLRAAGLEGCEDYLLQLQIAARHRVAAVSDYLVGYRLGDTTMSSNQERMYHSFQMAIALFRVDNPDISFPTRILRWQRASGVLVLARWQANRGRFVGALASLLVASWLDPLATAAALQRDATRLKRRVASRGRGTPAAFQSFYALNPAIVGEVGAAPSDWLSLIEAARVRWIDRIGLIADSGVRHSMVGATAVGASADTHS
jgi:glycosyltransferase involved in cell wall biosynthesis